MSWPRRHYFSLFLLSLVSLVWAVVIQIWLRDWNYETLLATLFQGQWFKLIYFWGAIIIFESLLSLNLLLLVDRIWVGLLFFLLSAVFFFFLLPHLAFFPWLVLTYLPWFSGAVLLRRQLRGEMFSHRRFRLSHFLLPALNKFNFFFFLSLVVVLAGISNYQFLRRPDFQIPDYLWEKLNWSAYLGIGADNGHQNNLNQLDRLLRGEEPLPPQLRQQLQQWQEINGKNESEIFTWLGEQVLKGENILPLLVLVLGDKLRLNEEGYLELPFLQEGQDLPQAVDQNLKNLLEGQINQFWPQIYPYLILLLSLILWLTLLSLRWLLAFAVTLLTFVVLTLARWLKVIELKEELRPVEELVWRED